MVCPVMARAPSLARKLAVAPTSSMVAFRRSGARPSAPLLSSCAWHAWRGRDRQAPCERPRGGEGGGGGVAGTGTVTVGAWQGQAPSPCERHPRGGWGGGQVTSSSRSSERVVTDREARDPAGRERVDGARAQAVYSDAVRALVSCV